jgi:hypothetical protein
MARYATFYHDEDRDGLYVHLYGTDGRENILRGDQRIAFLREIRATHFTDAGWPEIINRWIDANPEE